MVGRIDAARFPALADYVERLPAGLASYPEAESLGIMLRSAVSSHYFHPTWKELPAEIVGLVKKPPLPTVWIPTVLNDAVLALLIDTYYPTDAAVQKWSYERTMRMAALPMYLPLTKMAGVERFLRAAGRVHGVFQRGTELKVEAQKGEAVLLLLHPPYLHSSKNHLTNEAVFRAVLESAGGTGGTVTLVESRPDSARYDARWPV
jgi:hypothetical protein